MSPKECPLPASMMFAPSNRGCLLHLQFKVRIHRLSLCHCLVAMFSVLHFADWSSLRNISQSTLQALHAHVGIGLRTGIALLRSKQDHCFSAQMRTSRTVNHVTSHMKGWGPDESTRLKTWPFPRMKRHPSSRPSTSVTINSVVFFASSRIVDFPTGRQERQLILNRYDAKLTPTNFNLRT